MKLLLDECLPLDFRLSFPNHDAHTVQWAGLKGTKNGELLRAAESAGYEVFITVDQGILHQQERSGRKLSVVVLRARTNQIEDLKPLVSSVLAALETLQPGQTLVIPVAE